MRWDLLSTCNKLFVRLNSLDDYFSILFSQLLCVLFNSLLVNKVFVFVLAWLSQALDRILIGLFVLAWLSQALDRILIGLFVLAWLSLALDRSLFLSRAVLNQADSWRLVHKHREEVLLYNNTIIEVDRYLD